MFAGHTDGITDVDVKVPAISCLAFTTPVVLCSFVKLVLMSTVTNCLVTLVSLNLTLVSLNRNEFYTVC